MTQFDPNLFMNQTIDQPLETERTLCPPGDYQFVIDDFTAEALESIDFEYRKGPRAGQPGVMYKFSCPCVVQDEAVKTQLGVEKLVVYKQMNLDIDGGNLEWGKNKNIELGQLRNAVGQNVNGQPWAISNLRGAGPFMGRVEHREGKRKDGSAFKLAEIVRVAPIR